MLILIFVGCVMLLLFGFLISEWRGVKRAKDSGIVNAVRAGNVAEVTKFLETGVDPDIRDKTGSTSLGVAAAAGSAEMVTLLLDNRGKGAEIDNTDGAGWTALHHAAFAGHSSIVKLLLERGASHEPITVKEHFTPLDLAAQHGRIAIFEALVAGSKEHPLNLDHEDAEGWTALSRASFAGHVDFVRALIQAGADANGGKERTALSAAVEGDRVECAAALLDAGAVVEGWRTDGVTPLLEAVSRGQMKMVEFLISRGANVNARTSAGDTAVIMSALLNNVELTQMLVDEGCDINGKNSAGESAMSLARKNRTLKVIVFLESRRAKG